MESDPLRRALERLDTAIVRVESAASALSPASSASDGRLAVLEARHAKLRAGATDALARLDRLIGTQSLEGQG